MNYPRVSIIIPSYNQGEYLEQSLLSVLEQGYPNIELIVIDGNSRDQSVDVLKEYSPRLTYWESLPDDGQSQAINKGFARATGDIITFLSSDDYYLPGTFTDVAERYLRNPEVGAIIGAFCFLEEGKDAPNRPIRPFLGRSSPYDLTLGPPDVYRLHQVATFYTSAALNTVGRHVREEMKYVMDRDLLYRIVRKFPINLSESAYGVFRKHNQSKSTASILQFSREFADLYLLNLSGESESDRLRRKMAKYRLSRGYVKYASYVKNYPEKFWKLITSAILYPKHVLSSEYWRNYISHG